MSQLTVDQALQLALQHQSNNQLAEAEEIFRQILGAYPDQADAMHLLGGLYLQAKRPDLAEARVRQAILVRKEPAFYLTLGLVLQFVNRHTEALELYEKLVREHPEFIEGFVHLGVVLSIQGKFEEAATAFQHAIRLNPNHLQAQGNLGIVLCHLTRYDEALWLLRTAVSRSPRSADFRASLAAALYGTNQLDAALVECKEAVGLNPQHAHAQNLLSLIYRMLGRTKDALEPARVAAKLMPELVDIQINLGECLRGSGNLDEAAGHYRKLILRYASNPDVHNNMGNVLKDQGLLDEAIEEYKTGVELSHSPAIHSNLIYTMHYSPAYSASDLEKELGRYRDFFGEPLQSEIKPHENDRNPNRRLRIGYLSSEYRQHALGLNLMPLFSRHDKSAFEVYCYAAVDKPDFYTFRFRQLADQWRDIHRRSDEDLARMIREDKIDILLDLHQHMAGTRLPLYARKPAPVQIAFAGYPGSTGLRAIDYRLTDPYLEPEAGGAGPFFDSAEKILRLPASFWCYHAVTEVPVNELPAKKNGYVTFGNMNNFCKLNDSTFDLWLRIMAEVKNSRLLLLTPEGSARERVRRYFARHGIDGKRIEFVNRTGATDYYRYYHKIDISLDSFPCNGHTTSMDSWFMGVPVTSLEGQTLFGRATWSQASNLGLRELVGHTEREFVEISIGLAGDLDRLSGLRGTLRDRMKASPLMDEGQFAGGIEAAYRFAWKQWCAKGE